MKAYQFAEVIHDLTVIFIKRFVSSHSRTCDQMEQAARSGKQNIAEGSVASATSKETEIKLTNVAKASLEELRLDYEDYLRQHNLPIWSKESQRALDLKRYINSDNFRENPMKFAMRYDAESYCNFCIALIHVATYLLSRLIIAQQQQFRENGGIKELMYKARTSYRDKNPPKSDNSDNDK